MSGHAYFGQNLTKIRHAYVFDNGEYKKLRKAWYYDNGEFKQVWSGASVVSYYDGNTLLGVEEVDEGESVLHPSFSTSKEGYTLVAWKDAYYGDPMDELLATGEPMSVYAMYVPNTITAVTDGTIVNSDYVTGGVYAYVRAFWSTQESSTSFNLKKGYYETATCTVRAGFNNNSTGNLQVGAGYIDGNIINAWQTGGSEAYKTVELDSGGHSLLVRAISYEDYNQAGDIKVTSLVLSNPTPWT